jgi:hypothetical protein
MKALLTVPIVILATLSLVGWIVGNGDRTTLVPPPEAVAESFMRAVAAERPGPASEYLGDAIRPQMPRERLETLVQVVRTRTGGVMNVEAESDGISGDSAAAHTTLIPAHRDSMRVRFGLVRESGVWKIRSLEVR